jgi:hypothetical protein
MPLPTASQAAWMPSAELRQHSTHFFHPFFRQSELPSDDRRQRATECTILTAIALSCVSCVYPHVYMLIPLPLFIA